jgi:hypothetical protein
MEGRECNKEGWKREQRKDEIRIKEREGLKDGTNENGMSEGRNKGGSKEEERT